MIFSIMIELIFGVLAFIWATSKTSPNKPGVETDEPEPGGVLEEKPGEWDDLNDFLSIPNEELIGQLPGIDSPPQPIESDPYDMEEEYYG